MVTRESARLTTEGVPIRSADCIKTKFQGVPTDYQHPNGSVGGAARETLCAFCTHGAAREDDPLFECRGSRNGKECKLAWHGSCLLSPGGTAPPPQGDVFPCCTGWPARAEVDSKDRFDVGFTHYRKQIAKPGSLRSADAPADAPADASAGASRQRPHQRRRPLALGHPEAQEEVGHDGAGAARGWRCSERAQHLR